MTHTPGKLSVLAETDGDFVTVELLSASEGTIATVNDPSLVNDEVALANADRLALCWNSHEELLDIAEKAMEATRRAFRKPETALGWYANARATLDAIKAAEEGT